MQTWYWKCSSQRTCCWRSCTVFLAHAQKTSSAPHRLGGHHSTLEGHSGRTSNNDTSIPTDTSRPGNTGATRHVSNIKSNKCNKICSIPSTHSKYRYYSSNNQRSYLTYITIIIIIDNTIIIVQ
jgi:hypothetical protein